MDIDNQKAFDKTMKTAWVLWAAIFMSLFIYLIVCFLVRGKMNFDQFPESDYRTLRYVLMAVGAATFLAVPRLGRMLSKVGSGRISHEGSTGMADQHPAGSRYLVSLVVKLAFCESIGIYGLVLYFLKGDLVTLLLFLAVSALAMVIHRPDRNDLETMAREMESSSS